MPLPPLPRRALSLVSFPLPWCVQVTCRRQVGLWFSSCPFLDVRTEVFLCFSDAQVRVPFPWCQGNGKGLEEEGAPVPAKPLSGI